MCVPARAHWLTREQAHTPVLRQPTRVLPPDTRCVDIGGVVVGPSGMVVDVAVDAQRVALVGSEVVRMNGMPYPSMSQMIAILKRARVVSFVAGYKTVAFERLEPRPRPGAVELRAGVYLVGFCTADMDEDEDVDEASLPPPAEDDDDDEEEEGGDRVSGTAPPSTRVPDGGGEDAEPPSAADIVAELPMDRFVDADTFLADPEPPPPAGDNVYVDSD